MIYVIWQNDHITNVGLHLWWLILMGKTLLYGFKVDRLCRVFFIFNLGTPSDQLFVYWCCFQVWNIKQISDYAWLNPCIKCLFLHTKLLLNLPYNKKLNFFYHYFICSWSWEKAFWKPATQCTNLEILFSKDALRQVLIRLTKNLFRRWIWRYRQRKWLLIWKVHSKVLLE